MTKIQTEIPDKMKYYPVRGGNDLTKLRKWIAWAKKNSPNQKFIIVNDYKRYMADKEHRNYWKMRIKGGYESKYSVYGSY